MAFLKIDGYEISALVDGFSGPKDVSVESYSRSMGDHLEGTTYSIKKQYAFNTHYLSASDAEALEGWVRGRKHIWTFDNPDGATTRFTRYSMDSGLLISGATQSTGTVFSQWCLRVAGSSTAQFTTSFGSEGNWTLAGYFREDPALQFTPFLLRMKDGVQTTALFSADGTQATLGFLSYSVASGSLTIRLHGSFLESPATVDFAQLQVAPFAYTDGMFNSLQYDPDTSPDYEYPNQWTTGPARPPFVHLTGDAVHAGLKNVNPLGESGKVVKATVEDISTQPVVLDGAWTPNSRVLSINLMEK